MQWLMRWLGSSLRQSVRNMSTKKRYGTVRLSQRALSIRKRFGPKVPPLSLYDAHAPTAMVDATAVKVDATAVKG